MIAHFLGTVASSILLSGFDYTPFVTYGAYIEPPINLVTGLPVLGVHGNVAAITSSAKFGTKSMQNVDGASGLILDTASAPNWNLGTADWTCEFWVAQSGVPAASQYFCGRYSTISSARSWRIRTTPASRTIFVEVSNDGSAVITGTFTFANTAAQTAFWDGTWRHIAACRNGTNIDIFVDGVRGASRGNISTNAIFNPTTVGSTPMFGTCTSSNVPGDGFTGFYDEFRFTKGISRYNAASFTPPTTIFGRNSTDDPDYSYNLMLIDFESSFGVTQYGSIAPKTLTIVGDTATSQYEPDGIYMKGGANNILQFGNDAAHDLGSGDFTIEGYVCGFGAGGSSGPLFGTYDEVNGRRSWGVYYSATSSGSYQFRWSTDGTAASGNITICTSAEMGTSRVRRHIAVTRSGTTLRTYLDGVLKNTTTLSGTIFGNSGTGAQLNAGAFRNGTSLPNTNPDAITKAFRITKGYARYIGSSFSAPSEASFKTLA